MKKKIFYLIMSVIVSTSVLVGCGNNSNSGDKSANAQAEKSKKNMIDLKNTNKVDGVIEYTFTEIKADKKIEPAITKAFSLFYEAKDGTKYVDFMMNVKNLKSEKIEIENIINAKVKIDGKEYDNFAVIEGKNGEGFKLSNIAPIDPLTSSTVHILSDVPESELSKDIELTFKINNKDYKSTFKLADVAPKKKFVKLGDTISSEGHSQVKLNSLEFKKRVAPSKPGSFYNYYEVKDTSKIFLVLGVDVKNMKETELNADEVLNVKVTYNDKFKYDSFAIIEKSGGSDFSYANITAIDPLTTSKMYYLCEVPEEVKNGKVELEINLNGTKYYLNK